MIEKQSLTAWYDVSEVIIIIFLKTASVLFPPLQLQFINTNNFWYD